MKTADNSATGSHKFEAWMDELDSIFQEFIGLSVDDIEDQDYWDRWESGMPAALAYRDICDELGYNDDTF
jgi:hypothetical protein